MGSQTGAAMNETRNTRPRSGTGGPSPSELVAALDRLQDLLVRRLERLAELAAEWSEQAGFTPSEREEALRERVVALEASQARLQAELRRREQEWRDLLDSLEDDRRLLADAWERLEREQTTERPPPASRPASAVPTPEHVATAVHRPAPGLADDHVAREVLRQFQALKADVRRNAGRAGPA